MGFVINRRDVTDEFTNQIQKYLNHFNMSDTDLARLIGTSLSNIRKILFNNASLGLRRADEIANVFGLPYYLFGNPDYKIPSISKLPKSTRALLKDREINNQEPQYYEKNFAKELDRILDSNFLLKVKTAKELWEQLPIDIRERSSPSRVTDLLKKSSRKEKINIVGKVGRSLLYQKKSFI